MSQRQSAKTLFALLLWTLTFATCLFGGTGPGRTGSAKEAAASAVVPVIDAVNMRIQGEQRFHANCGRCHAAPEKFPPRMMKTVLRHMRVRATITDEDMHLVLFYMTQ